MDHGTFDRIVRGLVPRRVSRRSAVGRGLSTLAGLGVTGVVSLNAAARCGDIGDRCEKSGDCCAGRRCKRGRCQCLAGRARCGKICCPTGQVCADNRCVNPAGTCAAGADTCISSTIKCAGGSCACLAAMTGGATRCGQIISTPCGICGDDIDCRRQFGQGTFCVRPGGTNCGCQTGQGFCARQCA